MHLLDHGWRVAGGKQREELFKIWPRASGYLSKTVEAVNFSQCLNQALWYKSSPLLQLPHFTEREVSASRIVARMHIAHTVGTTHQSTGKGSRGTSKSGAPFSAESLQEHHNTRAVHGARRAPEEKNTLAR